MHCSGARGYILDLDGTLIRGRAVLPWAETLIEAIGRNFVVVSNDAEHTPAQMSRFLRTGGLKVDPERIVLAGTATLDLIAKERPAARLLLLGGASLRAYARRLGLTLAEDFCDLVVLARDRRFTYAKLAAAVEALRRGASLIATNPDRSHPGPEGAIVPETGALLAAILACVGPVKFRVVGKPEPLLFEAGLARLGVAANEAVMIGDNEETDGLGARRLGLRFIKVEPGNGRDGAPCFV